jgi:hypothetical protein
LPPGLVATDVDFGPFVLALTPHSVLAAPYHRLSSGIGAAHKAFAAPPDEVRKIVERAGVRYVATCGERTLAGQTDSERAASLRGQLQASLVPEWLAPLPASDGQPFRIYRVRL